MAATETKRTMEPRRPRWSLRYKMLVVIAAVLLVALGSHAYLATSLFSADKLAYVYDLNASQATSLAEQTRSSLNVLAKEVALFAREMSGSAEQRDRQALAHELFTFEQDVVRVEVWARGEGGLSRRDVFVNPPALALLGVGAQDLESVHHDRAMPLDAVARAPEAFLVTNASLPPDAAMLSLAFSAGDGSVAVVDFRHERLLRIFGRSRLHEAMLVDERGQILAHPDAAAVIGKKVLSQHPLMKQALGSPVAQGAMEFETPEGSVMLGAWSEVGLGRLFVLTQIDKGEALRASRELVMRSLVFGAAILLTSFLVSIFLSRLITAPLRRLRAATEQVGQGDFDVRVDLRGNDETGDLGRAFEQMLERVKETQAQLVQSEKMAAFGQLGAGITHEVKNPITALIGFAQLAQKRIDSPEKVVELLKLIEAEGLRCRDILQNFLKFARTSDGVWERIEVNRLVQESARMLRHQLAIHHVQLELNLADEAPMVSGSSSELQQVLLNLAMNAQQAMPRGGTVRIATGKSDDGMALISVSDDGPGVPAEIRDKIFDPFFTTKPSGQGTGLGLSISFNIVRSHRGRLALRQGATKGAVFEIRLPVAEPQAQQATG